MAAEAVAPEGLPHGLPSRIFRKLAQHRTVTARRCPPPGELAAASRSLVPGLERAAPADSSAASDPPGKACRATKAAPETNRTAKAVREKCS